MKYLKQPFFTSSMFSVELVASSESNFTFKKTFESSNSEYNSLDLSSFLSFEFYNKNKNLRANVWFSFKELYRLVQSMKTLAAKIEKSKNDIFCNDEEGNLFIPSDFASLKFIIEGLHNKKLLIKPAIREWKNNTETPGVAILIGSNKSEIFLDIDSYLSLTFFLDNFNLLQMGQNLAVMYFSQMSFRNSFPMNSIKEEEV